MKIKFFVPGKVQPGGSKRAFYIKKIGRTVVTDANKNVGGWKKTVKECAKRAYSGELLEGPLLVLCKFFILRPRSHYRSGKNSHLLKDSAPLYPQSKPDATKLWRSTEDAISGAIWKDDAQIVKQIIMKRYGTRQGALIKIVEIL